MESRPAARLLLAIGVASAIVLAVRAWLGERENQRASAQVFGATSGEALNGDRGIEVPPPDLEASSREGVPTSPAARAEHATPGTVLVRGALILVDGSGREHPHEDGQFELSIWGPSVSLRHARELGPEGAGLRERLRRRYVTTVQVQDGRWQELLPGHTSRSFSRGTLGGHPLSDFQVEELESHAPLAIELRVRSRALYPARMSIVDRETQRDLAGVRIVASEPTELRIHPGDRTPAIADAASPLEIPPPAVESRVYLVGAAGYAWQRVEWSHHSAAARIVELERSGALAIDVVGDWPLWDCAVALTTIEGAPYARFSALASLPLRIPGVAPGAYRLALVPRASLVEAQVQSLASTTATVIAGEATAVTLRGELGERPAAVELAGHVRMSSDWGSGGPHLLLRALGPTALWHMNTDGVLGGVVVERQRSSWSFRSAAAVAGGTYLLVERRTCFMQEIELGPLGRRDWQLEVPDPVAVRVEVVDRLTGAAIPSSELAWLPSTPPSAPRASMSGCPWIEASEEAGAFLARVPAWERLEFEAQAPGYGTAIGALSLRPGQPPCLRIELERR